MRRTSDRRRGDRVIKSHATSRERIEVRGAGLGRAVDADVIRTRRIKREENDVLGLAGGRGFAAHDDPCHDTDREQHPEKDECTDRTLAHHVITSLPVEPGAARMGAPDTHGAHGR